MPWTYQLIKLIVNRESIMLGRFVSFQRCNTLILNKITFHFYLFTFYFITRRLQIDIGAGEAAFGSGCRDIEDLAF